MSPMQQIFLGLGAGAKKTYVDNIFSTFLYTGNNTARSINNGLDLSTEGGLVWIKSRSNARANTLFDTVRGVNKYLLSDHNHAENSTHSDLLTAFNTNGFSLGVDANSDNVNRNDYTQASWAFRKAPGFFTIATWTGNSSYDQTISHDLGCEPGCIMYKSVSASGSWYVYHRGATKDKFLSLNSTGAAVSFSDTLTVTSTQFVAPGELGANTNGETYVAYVFAGGKGATDNAVDFDGSGDYLSIGSSSDFTFGTGDFTLECWVYPTSCSQDVGIPDPRAASTNAVQCMLGFNSSLQLFVYVNGSHLISPSSSTAMTQNKWQHVAYSRSGSTGKIYLDGKQVASVTDNNNYVQASAAYGWHAFQGATFDGQISNARITKGQALYTNNFNVPHDPLTQTSQNAVSSNVKLLCCNGSTTTASSVTPGTITANGDPAVTTNNSIFDDTAANVFGETGDQNVIKCGSYVGNGSATGPKIDLGFEPQWILIKNITNAHSWYIHDCMRGLVVGGSSAFGYVDKLLLANSTDAEYTNVHRIDPTNTGFQIKDSGEGINGDGNTLVYLAIRFPDGNVGKPADAGTDIFAMSTGAGTSFPNFTSGFPVDFGLFRKPGAGWSWFTGTRHYDGEYIDTNSNNTMNRYKPMDFESNTGWADADSVSTTFGSDYQSWMWKRSPGSFDTIPFNGNGSADHDVRHYLGNGTVPEMIWIKNREANSQNWRVYHKGLNGGTNPENYYLELNTDAAEAANANVWDQTAPTATHFTVGSTSESNQDGLRMTAFLFGSVSGISKVGSYSGQSGNLNLNLGFAARFIVIKRTNAAGEWWVFDSLRGIVSGNDYRIYLNDTSAQSNSDDWVDAHSDGITINNNTHQDILTTSSSDKYIYYAHA